MITLQHSLCNLIKLDGNIEKFSNEIPYVLLPDAIRTYLGERPLSHFEENPDNNDISWYEFTYCYLNLTKEKALQQPKHLADITKKSCLGEKSHIEEFLKRNDKLPLNIKEGILTHLIQDYFFDMWIRSLISYDNKYEPNAVFYFQGLSYSSEEIRKIIFELEEYGFYLLSYYCYEKFGIVTNQEWFDKVVKPSLKKEFPNDLVESTYKYMKINAKINGWITNKDWSHLDFIKKYYSSYVKLYNKVEYYTKNIDIFIKDYNNKLFDHKNFSEVTWR